MNPVAANSDPAGSTSPSLLEGLWRREPGAWERLATLYGPLVYGWCRGKGLQVRDAEDVVQEVFLTVAARVGEFRHDQENATFRGWLWTITRHKLGDWLRRQKNQETAIGGTDAQQLMLQTPADEPSDSTLTVVPGEAGNL